MSRTVFVHLGAPKTGTTYLQDRLAANRAELERHGVHYPLGGAASHFGAALDLIEESWGGQRDGVRGDWPALVRRVRAAPSRATVVVSHELLAGATRAQARAALAELSADGSDVHVVYAARDLGRQVPAEWQEGVKHRRKRTYARFLTKIEQTTRGADATMWFWRAQDLRGVLERWAADLPADRVHVVTVPPSGAPPEELFGRYCRAFGIDPAWAPRPAGGTNSSMGTAETALLRLVNKRLNQVEYPSEDYRRLVRELIVHETLAGRSGATRATLTPEAHAWIAPLAEEWIAWVHDQGYDVVGDLADLRVPEPTPQDRPVDKPSRADVLDAAVDAIVVLLQESVEPRATRRAREVAARAVRSLRRMRRT